MRAVSDVGIASRTQHAEITGIRIGLLVPSVNTVVESDMYRMAPDGVGFATTRLTGTSVDNSDAAVEAHLDQIAEVAEDAVEALPVDKLSIISFCCTGASFYRGGSGDATIAERISALSGRPCITTSRAAVEGLRHFRAKRVGVATPYVDTLNRHLVAFLEANEIEVVALASLRSESAYENASQSADRIVEIVDACDRRSAEAILIPCTNLPVIHLIDDLEKRVGKPVVSANQATFWYSLRSAGSQAKVPGYGALLTN